jgi:hypothetical protein
LRTAAVRQNQPEHSSGPIDALVGRLLKAVDRKNQRFIALRGKLQQVLACRQGRRVAGCGVIESISDSQAPVKLKSFAS